MQGTSSRFPTMVGIALLACASATGAETPPSLGIAASFVVLGGSSVTSVGSELTGNVGVSPGTTVSLTDTTVTLGTIDQDDAVARQAQRDNVAAYNDLVSRPCTTATNALTGSPAPGVICLSSSVQLDGTLELHGDANAVFIFKVTGGLTTGRNSAVLLGGGAISSNVFWQVSDSVTLGEQSAFIGSILAVNNITVKPGVTMSGRALAQRGAVTLENDEITLCCDLIRVLPATLPDATINVPYKQSLTATGGTPPHTFSLIEHPEGLAISPNGEISWTPTKSGDYAVAVTATDSKGCSGVQAYVLHVVCPVITLSPLLPPKPACPAFDQRITASGGKEPYVFSGTAPAGMNFSDSRLSGTPTDPGCTDFTVTVTDADGCTGTRVYRICGLSIAPPTLPQAFVDVPYAVTLIPSGGTGPYTCAACGALPFDFSPPNCVLSGTPKTSGKYPIKIAVVDSISGAANRNYELVVGECQIIFSKTKTLPDATVCNSYNETITVSGRQQSYTFKVSTPLPAGLSYTLSETAVTLKGTPEIPTTEDHPDRVTITATDQAGCSRTETYDLTIYSRVTLEPASPPCGKRGVQYPAFTLPHSGGKPDYDFRVTFGALPDGLVLSQDTGVLSGTPTTSAVTSDVEVTVTDALLCSATRKYTICICPTLTIAAPPRANVGSPYSHALQGAGGTGPYTFTSNDLPGWLSLPSLLSSGTLSGTPTTPGNYVFAVTVTDLATGCSDTVSVTVTVSACALSISPPSTFLPDGTVAVFYSQAFVASGGTAPYTYVVAVPPSPPPGLTLSPGGVLSGFPTTPGRFNFAVRATDAAGLSCAQVYTIDVGPVPPGPPPIPALSGWAMLFVSVLLAATGYLALRK
jgi:hypothetical protein